MKRKFGGRDRDRTCDLIHAMDALSQLSYTPVTERTTNSLADLKHLSEYPHEIPQRWMTVPEGGAIERRFYCSILLCAHYVVLGALCTTNP